MSTSGTVSKLSEESRQRALHTAINLILEHHFSWEELHRELLRVEAEGFIETIREELDGEEIEYKRLGNYVVAMHDLCGGQPVIKTATRITRINAGVPPAWLEQGFTPEQVAADFDIPVEAVLEAKRLELLFDYDRSYA